MSAPTEQEILNLRTALKRCSHETIEAAVRFRTTRDPAELPTIVYGIIERHLAPETSRSLSDASDETRLIEDLGVDSLTLLEIVLSIEETIGISIENEELREIRTLGQVKTFIAEKISGARQTGAAAPSKVRQYNTQDIVARLPQQPPFLFVDSAEIEGEVVRAKYLVRGDEYFLQGHFKDNPVMPASIVFEAIGQAACLWVLETAPARLQIELKTNEVLFASMEEAHFYRRAKPGDLIEMEATLAQIHAPLAVFGGVAKLRGEKLAQIDHLVLAFGQGIVEHVESREGASSEPDAKPATEDAVAAKEETPELPLAPTGKSADEKPEEEEEFFPLGRPVTDSLPSAAAEPTTTSDAAKPPGKTKTSRKSATDDARPKAPRRTGTAKKPSAKPPVDPAL